MDKIRLGNDIEMRWSIFTRDGDNKVPYNLEGRALTLSVVNRTGESEIEFFAEGNIVTGVFRGRDQRILGKHGVILRENNGKDGMRTIDACDAFELVACSCEEALGSPGTIQLFHLTFDSTIGAITGTIDPILNYEAEQAEAERKANEIIRKANEQQRIDNEKQRNVNEILRNIAEEERKSAEQERIVNEDLRKADEAERKTNEENRLQSESERVSSEEERLYAESIRVANENARIASEAKRKEAETARIEAEDKRIVSEKARLSAESSRIANEDSRRANEDSRLSAEAKRVSAEEERQIAEDERQAKFASMVVQTTGEATDQVMSQKSVTEALKAKQNKLTAGKGISIDGDVISATLDMDIVRVVDALPSVGEANLIYLVPAEQPSESDLFEEWVWTDKWERIGSAKIDLSNYATKGYVDTKISSTEENLVHKDGFERITERKQFQKGIDIGLSNSLVANDDGVQSGAWLDQNEDPAPFIVADPTADEHAATKYYVDEGLATKANIQHQHTVADITDFPELYYDATAFFASGAYPSDKYEELLEAVKAKKTVYATLDEEGNISYVFFTSLANSDASSSRVLLTTVFVDGSFLYLNTFVLRQSGMTRMQENITGKANKATTLAGYGIGDAYNKSEVDVALAGKQSTLTAGNGISIEGNVISSTVDSLITPITYAELVALRDSSSLVAGMQYRITDYACTTTQENTKSAGHPFDIIVTADSENTLNEEARAIQHEGDTYFADCDLNAWKIWYCLDNDATRFAWADSANGKGVIYRMIDEWNNDVPYDFKNIQFKRYILDARDAIATDVAKDGELNAVKEKLKVMPHRIHTSLWYYGSYISDVYPNADENTKYVPFGDILYNVDGPGVLCPINEANSNWFYTFSDTSFNDNTLTGQGNVHDNVVKSNKYALVTIDGEGRYSFEEKENICLNDIIFIGKDCNYNSFGNDCYYNSFGNYCNYNSFGNSCNSNSFGNDCNSNSFGNDCYSNSFGNYCNYNSFGNDCNYNSFGNSCNYNSFGNSCYYNSFGNDCNYNSFGNSCNYNSFGNYCNYNSFGNDCNYNSFGNYCNYNSFGNYCNSNSFGNDCNYNSFGNNCSSIKFSSSSSATTKYNYYQHNHFGDGCQYILFKGAETASSSAQVQNYNFAQGLQGTSSAYLTIDGVRSRAYETKVAKNSSGELKIYCEADLIQ